MRNRIPPSEMKEIECMNEGIHGYVEVMTEDGVEGVDNCGRSDGEVNDEKKPRKERERPEP